MTEIEQKLNEEIAKRDARLKKAIQVFNDQKATIERQANELTQRDARIAELEAKIAEYTQDDTKFFEQESIIDSLNDQVKELHDSLENEIAAHDADNTQNLKALADKTADFDGLVKKYEERKTQITALQAEYDDFKKDVKDKQAKMKEKYNELKSEHEAYTAKMASARTDLSNFLDKMKICVASIGDQAAAINTEISNSKFFE